MPRNIRMKTPLVTRRSRIYQYFGCGSAALRGVLERRADMYISTLSDFIEAMGGKLEIRAIFPDGDIRITQFQKLRKSA